MYNSCQAWVPLLQLSLCSHTALSPSNRGYLVCSRMLSYSRREPLLVLTNCGRQQMGREGQSGSGDSGSMIKSRRGFTCRILLRLPNRVEHRGRPTHKVFLAVAPKRMQPIPQSLLKFQYFGRCNQKFGMLAGRYSAETAKLAENRNR